MSANSQSPSDRTSSGSVKRAKNRVSARQARIEEVRAIQKDARNLLVQLRAERMERSQHLHENVRGDIQSKMQDWRASRSDITASRAAAKSARAAAAPSQSYVRPLTPEPENSAANGANSPFSEAGGAMTALVDELPQETVSETATSENGLKAAPSQSRRSQPSHITVNGAFASDFPADYNPGAVDTQPDASIEPSGNGAFQGVEPENSTDDSVEAEHQAENVEAAPVADESADIQSTDQAKPAIDIGFAAIPEIREGMVTRFQQIGINNLNDLAKADLDLATRQLGGVGLLVPLNTWIETARRLV